MLLLAIVAVSGMALARQAGMLPPRADLPRVVLAAALTGGGAGYLLPNPALAWMALLALPLLLIWVAGTGVWLSLDPAASQNDRQHSANPETPITAASLRSRPRKPAHRRLTCRGQTTLASGTCTPALGVRNHPPPATSQDLTAATARPGTWRASRRRRPPGGPDSCRPPERPPGHRTAR